MDLCTSLNQLINFIFHGRVSFLGFATKIYSFFDLEIEPLDFFLLQEKTATQGDFHT